MMAVPTSKQDLELLDDSPDDVVESVSFKKDPKMMDDNPDIDGESRLPVSKIWASMPHMFESPNVQIVLNYVIYFINFILF